MKEEMLKNVVETIDFIQKRVEAGWNARDEHVRSFNLSQADKMLERLSLDIRCEMSREEELNKKVAKGMKEMRP